MYFFMSESTACCTTVSLSSSTGSRLVFWLHALVSAFKESGYWSGVVTSFSIKQPITRASFGVNSMFMDAGFQLGWGCFRVTLRGHISTAQVIHELDRTGFGTRLLR